LSISLKAFKDGIFPDGGDPQGKTKEDFQEMLKNSQTLMSSLKELGMSFGVAFGGVIEFLTPIVQGFTSILNAGGVMPKILLGVVAPLAMISMGISKLIGGFKGVLTTIQGVTSQMRLMTAEVARFNTTARSGGAPMPGQSGFIGPVQQGGGGTTPITTPDGKAATYGKKLAKGGGIGAMMGLFSLANAFMSGDEIDGKLVGGLLGGLLGGAIGALIPIPGMAFIGAILGDMAGKALFAADGVSLGGSESQAIPMVAHGQETVISAKNNKSTRNLAAAVADTVMTNFASQQAAAQVAQRNVNVSFAPSAKVRFDGHHLEALLETKAKDVMNGKNTRNGPSMKVSG